MPDARLMRVIDAGLYSTIQDLGRPGWCRIGLPPGGAADTRSLCIGNRLLGNPDDAAGVEMTLVGGTFEFVTAELAVVTGARCRPTRMSHRGDSSIVEMNTVLEMNPGDLLHVGRFSHGARAYLTVRGGFCVPKIMGSRSTYVPAAIGGCAGRPLQRGDSLRIGTEACATARTGKAGKRINIDFWGERNTLRVLRGPHVSRIGEATFRALLSARLRVSDQSDRAGIRLTCAPLPQVDLENMITEAMPCGAIQLTREGLPVILGVDRPTTGGYPILATVIAADWPVLGQLRPRTEIRLVECSIDAARITAAEERRRLDEHLPPNPAHGTTEGNESF